MRRVMICVFISVGCLFLSGCIQAMHGYTHPHSKITAPTFCLYYGSWKDDHPPPVAIYQIRVFRAVKVNDERFEWGQWKVYSPMRVGEDQMAWSMDYEGDNQDVTRPFSCLTYGEVPPGYNETTPAVPLIPERLYTVLLLSKHGTLRNSMYFIIRADSTGRPTQLEHTTEPNRLDQIHVITHQ